MEAIEFAPRRTGLPPTSTLVRGHRLADVLDARRMARTPSSISAPSSACTSASTRRWSASSRTTSRRAIGGPRPRGARLLALPAAPLFAPSSAPARMALSSGNTLGEATVHAPLLSSSSATCARSRLSATPARRSISTPSNGAPGRSRLRPFARPGRLYVRPCEERLRPRVIHGRHPTTPTPASAAPQRWLRVPPPTAASPSSAPWPKRRRADRRSSTAGATNLVDAHARFRGPGACRASASSCGAFTSKAPAKGQLRAALRSIDDHSDKPSTTGRESASAFVLARGSRRSASTTSTASRSAGPKTICRSCESSFLGWSSSASPVFPASDRVPQGSCAMPRRSGTSRSPGRRSSLLRGPRWRRARALGRWRSPTACGRRRSGNDVAKLGRGGKAGPGVMVIVDGVFHDKARCRSRRNPRRSRTWMAPLGAFVDGRDPPARDGIRSACVDSGASSERFEAEDDLPGRRGRPAARARRRPYRAVTEPLVHLRAAIDHLVSSGESSPTRTAGCRRGPQVALVRRPHRARDHALACGRLRARPRSGKS